MNLTCALFSVTVMILPKMPTTKLPSTSVSYRISGKASSIFHGSLSSWSNKVPLRTQLHNWGTRCIRQTIGQMVWVMRKKARPYDTVFLLSCSIFHKMCGWLFRKVTSRYVYIQIRLKLPTANCRAFLHCISYSYIVGRSLLLWCAFCII